MKKLLSILGAIGLTATSTTSLISCVKNQITTKTEEVVNQNLNLHQKQKNYNNNHQKIVIEN